jgi:DNA-directed RNA polymerase specialized sigma24 family protein
MVRRSAGGDPDDPGPRQVADPSDGDVLQPSTATLTAELVRLETRRDVFDAESQRAADSLARRQAEHQLWTELAGVGFAGPGWDRFETELGRYGYAVVTAWLATLEVFTQCARKGCAVGEPPMFWTEEDREDLANDTVNAAIGTFRKKAQNGSGWSVGGGASLKTYFIGSCVFAFPNIYRKWRNATDEWTRGIGELAGIAADRDRWADDPVELAILRMRVNAGFEVVEKDPTTKAVVMAELGYSHTEIAAALGLSVGAVGERLRRYRHRSHGADHRSEGGHGD